MTGGVKVSVEELAIVRQILRKHLPSSFDVFAFGSRAQGTCKPWSDLDLAIGGPVPVPLALLASLNEAFEESDLAWKVDLVDFNAVSSEFRTLIEASKVPLPT